MSNTKAPDIVDGWLRLEAGYFLGEIFVAMYEPDALEVSHGVPEDDETRRSFDPHTTACMPLPVLRALLSAHGLHIVTEAERKVLEANAALDSDWLDKCKFSRDIRLFRFAEAELARRNGT